MTSTALTVTTSPKDEASFLNQWKSGTPAAHPLVDHVMKSIELRSYWAARSVNNASVTAQVFAHGLDIESWHELWQLQAAVWQRMQALQFGWMEDWKSWLQYASQVKGANTMTKLVEREGNVSAQFAQLLANQATDLMGLSENIQIDYAYWINQKQNEIRQR